MSNPLVRPFTVSLNICIRFELSLEHPERVHHSVITTNMMYEQASRVLLYMKSMIKWDFVPRLHLPNGPYSDDKAELVDVFDDDNDISSLAHTIKTHAETLARYAKERNIRPSLAANGDSLKIAAADKYAVQAKAKLLFAMKSLQGLVKGPLESLMDIGVCLHEPFMMATRTDKTSRLTRSSASKQSLASGLPAPCSRTKNCHLKSYPADADSM